jgi:hypothetical protein
MRISLSLLLLAALAAPAVAQDPAAPATAAPTATIVSAPNEPRLVFEREVFDYSGHSRRDPFRPLTGSSMGPLFEDLVLKIILFSPDPTKSVVMLNDADKKEYRLRRGDTVGNATVIDIGESRVVFAVIDFGIRRQEVLELKVNGRERN